MKLFIVAPFCTLPDEPGFNRFLSLAEIASKSNEVTLITSRFRHSDKTHRDEKKTRKTNYKLVLIDEPGYSKNVSLARLWSHHIFCKNFKAWAEVSIKNESPDFVYSAYPLIKTNTILGDISKKTNFKLIIDIQDVWPESISAAIPFISKLPPAAMPLSWRAEQAYRQADAFIAVSETYLKRAQSKNPTTPGKVVYIGCDTHAIGNAPSLNLSKDKKRLFYCGTLSHSYDMFTVIRGFNYLRKRKPEIELHIMGTGPDLAALKKLAGDDVYFHGPLSYPHMISAIKSMDIAINPIKSNSQASITNKLSDYLFLQKPIINSQENNEARRLIEKNTHSHYKSGNVDGFIMAAESILEKAHDFQCEARPLDFDRGVTYQGILEFISKELFPQVKQKKQPHNTQTKTKLAKEFN